MKLQIIQSILETLKTLYIGRFVEVYQQECQQWDTKKWNLLETVSNERSDVEGSGIRAILPIRGMVTDVMFQNGYEDKEYTLLIKEIVVGTENVSRIFYCGLNFF